MDKARCRATGEIVEAKALNGFSDIDREGYACAYCDVDVRPVSYAPPANRRAPYFFLVDGVTHLEGCPMGTPSTQSAVRTSARLESSLLSGGVPVPYPSRLKIRISTACQVSDNRSARSNAALAEANFNAAARFDYEGYEASTIQPICRTFVEFPHDRDRLPLAIPRCSGKTYSTVFRHLGFDKTSTNHYNFALWYSCLHWSPPTRQSADVEEWAIQGGIRLQTNENSVLRYRLRICWSNWSESRRELLARQIKIAHESVVGNKWRHAWVFFVGALDPSDPALFVVNNSALFTFVSANSSTPDMPHFVLAFLPREIRVGVGVLKFGGRLRRMACGNARLSSTAGFTSGDSPTAARSVSVTSIAAAGFPRQHLCYIRFISVAQAEEP